MLSALGVIFIFIMVIVVMDSNRPKMGEVTFTSLENNLLFTLHFTPEISHTYVMKYRSHLTFKFNPGQYTFQWQSTATGDEGTVMISVFAGNIFKIDLPIENKEIGNTPINSLTVRRSK